MLKTFFRYPAFFIPFTLFKNYSKCRIWIFQFWHFPPIFVVLKVTCLVTLFDLKFQIWKTPQNWTICGIFDELLSTQNVNVARFARNDGRLNIYSFSLYEPHDFLTNVFFLMTFYWNEEFTKRPFVKYVPYYYIWYFFLWFSNTVHLPFFVT